MTRVRSLILMVVLLALAMPALASWYDDYDAGLKAARNGQWSVVADKMSKAIAGNGSENNKARTYGAIFINYHPYYYRGVANMNLGRYEQAVSDFEKASGAGEVDLGSIDSLIQRAKSKIADSTPEPTPVPTRPTPTPPPTQTVAPTPVPTAPSIDPALRQRAQTAISNANARISAAQQRKATASPQYQQAMQSLADARTRVAGARSNSDLEQAIAVADNASLYADSAQAAAVASVVPPNVTLPPVPRPTAAADAVLSDYKPMLRNSLESYFAGDFDAAARGFEQLTRKLPNNGWIWAFLGASQYSIYAFEADEQYKQAALDSFKKAKRYRKWSNGLPEKYFSKRIRRVFASAG